MTSKRLRLAKSRFFATLRSAHPDPGLQCQRATSPLAGPESQPGALR